MPTEICLPWGPAYDVLSFLGCMVLVGQSIVILTPTERDDEFFARLEAKPIIGHALRALKAFAVFHPRRKG